jgi:hypothetical protein
MDRFDSLYARRHAAHRDQALNLITDYRWFAPAIMTLNETHQRLEADAALDRLLSPAGLTDRRSSPLQVVRHRLGDLLIRLGTHLRGVHAVEPGALTESVAAASGTGG